MGTEDQVTHLAAIFRDGEEVMAHYQQELNKGEPVEKEAKEAIEEFKRKVAAA